MGTENLEDYEDDDLHVAVRYGDYKDAKAAVENRCNPNTIGMYMWSALHEAADNGDIKILKLLLKHKGDPNNRDKLKGCTAVHYAAKEGQVECLRLLLNAGGLYNVKNNDGETPLDVAITDECEDLLHKQRVQELMKLSKDKAKEDALERQSRLKQRNVMEKNDEKSTDTHHFTTEEACTEITQIPEKSSSTNLHTRAWGSIKTFDTGAKGKDTVVGYIQLSFEYNSRKSNMKIRVWQVSDLLLPPPETSMINTIYVKSYLYPDKTKNSKRKTEEVRVASSDSTSTLERKNSLAKQLSIQTIFKPSTFKFTKPLEYKDVTKEFVDEKVIELQVFITQKYSRKSFIVANMKLALDVAIKKLVREKFPLKPCMQAPLPESMQVYTSQDVKVIYAARNFNSNPNLRNPSLANLRDGTTERASSDSDLKRIEVQQLEKIPSVEIAIPLDESGNKQSLKEISIESEYFKKMERKRSRTEIVMPLDRSGNRYSLSEISVVRELNNTERKPVKNLTAVSMPGEISSDEPEKVRTELFNHLPRLQRRKSKSTPELTTTDESEMSEMENSQNKQTGIFSTQLKRDEYSKLEKGKSKKSLAKQKVGLDFYSNKNTPKLTSYASLAENDTKSKVVKKKTSRIPSTELASVVDKSSHIPSAEVISIFDRPATPEWDNYGDPLSFEGIPLDDLTPTKDSVVLPMPTTMDVPGKRRSFSSKLSGTTHPGRALIHYEDDLTGEKKLDKRKESLTSYQPKPVRDFSPSKRSPRKGNEPIISSPSSQNVKICETSFSPRLTKTLVKDSNDNEKDEIVLNPDKLKKRYLEHAAKLRATPDHKLRMFQRTSKEPHPATPHEFKLKAVNLNSSESEKLDPFFIPESPSNSPAVHGIVKKRTKPK